MHSAREHGEIRDIFERDYNNFSIRNYVRWNN